MTKQIFVAHRLVDNCKLWSEKVYAYRSRDKVKDTYSKGARSKRQGVQDLYNGKVSECAVCIYLSGCTKRDIDWSIGAPDVGYDLAILNQRIEVKTTDNIYAKRLMWPVTRKDSLISAPIDVFVWSRVLSSKLETLGQTVDLIGCVTKERFINHHWSAKGLRGIIDDTQFMHEKQLDDIASLRHHVGIYHKTSQHVRKENP